MLRLRRSRSARGYLVSIREGDKRLRLMHRRRLFAELLEDRRMLAAISHPWDAGVTFDQFSGGEAKVLAIGYETNGTEKPELLGFDFCRATSCGGSPFSLGTGIEGSEPFAFGANAELAISGRLGIEYGFYANAGTASLLYDGSFRYDVDESGSNGVGINTSVDIASGALFTQSPTIRTFVDLVAKVDGSISGNGCFFECASGSDNFSIDKRVPLLSINRNADGEVKFIGDSLLEGIYDKLKEAREESGDGEKQKKDAERDLAKARTPEEYDAALRKLDEANKKIESGKNKERDTNERASNNAKGKKFGGGKIVQISVGEAPGDLLGVEFEMGVGIGFKEVVDVSKRLGTFSVTLPDIALTDTTLESDMSLSAQTELDDPRRNLANLTLDVGAIVGSGYGLGSTSVSTGPISIDLTTVSYDLSTSLRVNQDVRSDPTQQLRFQFTDPVTNSAKSVNAIVNGVQKNNVTSITFNPGDQVNVLPSGNERIKITPQLIPKYRFSNDIGLDLDIQGILRALALKLTAFGETLIDVPPLISRSDTLGQFDFGDVFEKQFEVQAEPVTFDSFIVGGPALDLGVSVSGAEQIQTDKPGSYKVTITNAGPNVSTNARATLTLPPEFAFSAEKSSPGCTAAGQVITCNAGTIPVGGSVEFEVAFTPSIPTPRTFNVTVDVDSDDRDTNAFNDRARIQSLVTRPQTFFVDHYSDHLDAACPSSQTSQCTLRAAIEEANANPGPDTIWVVSRFDQDLVRGQLEITDSVDIIVPQGVSIGVDERIERFWSDASSGRDASLAMRMPNTNRGQMGLTIKDLINAINREPTTEFDDGAKFMAELIEGDPTEAVQFQRETHLFERVTSGGNANTAASGVITLPGNDAKIKLTARQNGEQLNNVSFSLEAFDDTSFSTRSRIFQISGDKEIEVRLSGMTIRGGNAQASPTLTKSVEIKGNSVQRFKEGANEGFKISTNTLQFEEGDTVVYSAVDGEVIGGLIDGETYTVFNLTGESSSLINPLGFQLKDLSGNLVALTPPTNGQSRHRFNAHGFTRDSDGRTTQITSDINGFLAVDPVHGASNSFYLVSHGFNNGDVIRYDSPTPGAKIQGLEDDATYFIINATADTFQLALLADGPAIDIDGRVVKFDEFNGFGGAILVTNPNAKLMLNRVRMENNSADFGGALLSMGDVELNRVVVTDNYASEFGGGLYIANANSQIVRTVFQNNRAEIEGGAIRNKAEFGGSSLMTISESDFANNASPSGSAISNVSFYTNSTATLDIAKSTFAQNGPGTNIQSQGFDEGVAEVKSSGLNLDDDPNADFDELGDTTSTDLMALTHLTIPGNQASAKAAVLQFFVPSAQEPVLFEVDDARFEVVAGSLQLKEGEAIDPEVESTIPLRITAIDISGRRWGQSFTIQPVDVPSTPTNFGIRILTPQSIQLRWRDVANESSYEIIERDNEGIESLYAILPADSTTFEISELAVLSSHTYIVQARNVAGSARSVARTVSLPVPPPTIPLDLVADASSPTTLQLSWVAAVHADGYRILVDGEVVETVDKAVLSFELADRPAGSKATIVVEAFNDTAASPSEPLEAQLPPAAPGVPAKFQFEKLSETSLRLSWDDSDTESEYRVYRRLGESGAEDELATLDANTTSFEVADLEPSTLYSFHVRAVNITGSAATVRLAVRLDSNNDVETVFFEGSGQTIDLQSIGNDLYPQLVTVSIDGSGPNRLMLKAEEIAGIVTADDDIDLIIGSDDLLTFAGTWRLIEGQISEGKFYRVLRNGEATVRLDGPADWQNPIRKEDVDGDGRVFPVDVLLILNELNANKFSNVVTRRLIDPATLSAFANQFLDVDGDGRVFPVDVLLVINELNRSGGSGERGGSGEHGEGEADDQLRGMSNARTIGDSVTDAESQSFAIASSHSLDRTEMAHATANVAASTFLPISQSDRKRPSQSNATVNQGQNYFNRVRTKSRLNDGLDQRSEREAINRLWSTWHEAELTVETDLQSSHGQRFLGKPR